MKNLIFVLLLISSFSAHAIENCECIDDLEKCKIGYIQCTETWEGELAFQAEYRTEFDRDDDFAPFASVNIRRQLADNLYLDLGHYNFACAANETVSPTSSSLFWTFKNPGKSLDVEWLNRTEANPTLKWLESHEFEIPVDQKACHPINGCSESVQVDRIKLSCFAVRY